jgi:PAS domain-containing protein
MVSQIKENNLKFILDRLNNFILIFSGNKKMEWANSYVKQNIIFSNKEDIIAQFKLLGIDLLSLIKNNNSHHTRTMYLNVHGQLEYITWEKICYKTDTNKFIILIGKIKTTEILLRKEIYNLKNILSQVPGFVFWKDKNSVLQGCNLNFARQVGLNSSEEIVGKTDHDLPWTTEQTEKFLKDDKTVITTKQPIINQEEIQTQENGEEITLLTQKVPLYDEKKRSIWCLRNIC